MKQPRNANKIPKRLLAIIQTIAVLEKPFCNNFIFSKEKEENVVKPPKNPINNSNLHFSSIMPFADIRPNKKPIISDPNRLTVSVPKGNVLVYFCSKHVTSQYLQIVPSAPPPAMYKYFNIVLYKLTKIYTINYSRMSNFGTNFEINLKNA